MTDPRQLPPAPAGLPLDPRWTGVMQEGHRRPPVALELPARITHLVFRAEDIAAPLHREIVADWLAAIDATLLLDSADQLLARRDGLQVKWERHTEFWSLTLYADGPGAAFPEPPPPVAERTTARLVAALRMAIDGGEPETVTLDGDDTTSRALVNGRTAGIASAFIPDAEGYVRFSIVDADDNSGRRGRMTQRLIELETYRVLALYAWPDVEAASPALAAIEDSLARLSDALREASPEDDARLLDELTALAADLEHVVARTHFRFNASSAYADLVTRRFEDLREERIGNSQRLSSFVNRRLVPAARTYRAILRRQVEMSDRVARTNHLLRSRVDVELSRQNQSLLQSMDRRAHMQYRLQHAVEGLSVMAISYYAVGLLIYFITALAEYVPMLDAKLIAGLGAPIVILVTFFALRRLRRRLTGPGAD